MEGGNKLIEAKYIESCVLSTLELKWELNGVDIHVDKECVIDNEWSENRETCSRGSVGI